MSLTDKRTGRAIATERGLRVAGTAAIIGITNPVDPRVSKRRQVFSKALRRVYVELCCVLPLAPNRRRGE